MQHNLFCLVLMKYKRHNENGELRLRSLRWDARSRETRRSIVRWIALSLGVISPGETRLSAVAVLDAILNFQLAEKRDPQVPELKTYIEKYWSQMNEKTLRYHLLQLKNMGIISSTKRHYHLTWPEIGEQYDGEAWINAYLDGQVEPVRNKLNIAIRELKSRGYDGK